MTHYHVINEAKTYGRVIDAATGFEARCIVARACQSKPSYFFAIRKDTMTDIDWKMWERITNK